MCAIMIGVSKTGLPGIGILSITLISGIMPARQATGFILPMLIMGDIFAVAYYRRHAVWPHLFRIFPWAALGIIIGAMIMGRITDQVLRPVIGLIILGMLVLHYWNSRRQNLTIPTQWWFAAPIGLAAGITTMMANAAGPILIIYLLAMRLPKNEFIGTGAWYFLLLNCFKVPFGVNLGIITPQSLGFNAALFPCIALGAIAGFKLLPIIPEKRFADIMQILAAIAAVKLLF